MERRDIRQVTELLQKYLKRFQLAPSMGEEEVAHWFLPQDNIIDTYVVEVCGFRFYPQSNSVLVCLFFQTADMSLSLSLSFQGTGGVLTDFTSFYTLPSTVMHHPLHRSLKAAYSFYNVHTQTPLLDLMNDALILAKLVMLPFYCQTPITTKESEKVFSFANVDSVCNLFLFCAFNRKVLMCSTPWI